jgi:hypothetical protein
MSGTKQAKQRLVAKANYIEKQRNWRREKVHLPGDYRTYNRSSEEFLGMAKTQSYRPLVTSSIEKCRKVTVGLFIDNLLSGSFGCTFDCVSDSNMKIDVNQMLIRPWFIGMLTLVLIHQIVQKVLGFNIPIVDSFLDPLLFMPILLHLILWEQRFLYGKGSHYVLSRRQIISILVFVAVFCEYFFPRWNNNFTMDYWDIICYTIGTLLFGSFLNTPLKIRETSDCSKK